MPDFFSFSGFGVESEETLKNPKEKLAEDGGGRDQEAESVAIIKKSKKGKTRREKSPLVSRSQMCEGFYYSQHLFHLARFRRKKNEEISSVFPGFVGGAHASFVVSTPHSIFCFINVVVHYDT